MATWIEQVEDLWDEWIADNGMESGDPAEFVEWALAERRLVPRPQDIRQIMRKQITQALRQVKRYDPEGGFSYRAKQSVTLFEAILPSSITSIRTRVARRISDRSPSNRDVRPSPMTCIEGSATRNGCRSSIQKSSYRSFPIFGTTLRSFVPSICLQRKMTKTRLSRISSSAPMLLHGQSRIAVPVSKLSYAP